MYLSAYHFDGDPSVLVAAHDRLVAQFPPNSFDLHVCVVREHGIVVFDGCPSEADFVAFSQGPEFRDGLAAAGLPRPRVEPIGDVHGVFVGAQAVA